MSIRHFLSTSDIDVDLAMEEMSEGFFTKPIIEKRIANLFYEPSTRTSSSFWAAATNLGHNVLTINNVQFSSVSKGETLEDTIRTLGSYVDCIVLRHPEKGAAKRAAEVSSVPIINAGDGDGEHPTQTMLDLFTIYKEFGKLKGLNIVTMGDAKYGRTIHSLVNVLNGYVGQNNIYCIAPKSLRLPSDYGDFLWVDKTEDASEWLKDADVLYVVRTQRERMDKRDYYNFHNDCVVDEYVAETLNSNAIVMHPFPRTHELPTWFDNDKRGRYFDQMKYGLYVRQYILNWCLDV